MKWPPDSAKDRLNAIRKARAWWSGEKLKEHSGTHFWKQDDDQAGTQWSTTGMRREHRIHVPIAADLARVSADYLFGGGIELPEDERIRELDERVGLSTLLPEAAERASGMGEVYLRTLWRNETEPLLSVIDPDRVVPIFQWGRLAAAEVGSDLPRHQGVLWVHVERHEPGVVRHFLYRKTPSGTSGDLQIAPLSAHPETRALEPEVPLPDALADRLAIVYVPNARPKTPRPGGASDLEGTEGMMAAVDEAASSLTRDIRLGKGRLVVSEWLLDRTKPLDGAIFDTNAEVFSPIAGGDDETTRNSIVPFQPELRVNPHLDAIRDLVQRIVSSAGYSPESLIANRSQLPEAGVARRLREGASIRTTQRKIAIWRPAIAEVLSNLAVIAYRLDEAPVVPISVRSSYAPDIAETANVVQALAVAGAASTETKVRLLHPTWTDAQIATEVQRISDERPSPAPVVP